jgi:hypothetical protein
VFGLRSASSLKQLPLAQRAWFIPLIGTLGVISWFATAASQSVGNASGRQSEAYFTLSGEMPAHTVLHATAQYDPVPGQRNCPYQHPERQLDTVPGDAPQPFSFQVPLAYELPGCMLSISDIKLVIDGFYGPDNQHHSSSITGAITVRDAQVKHVSNFPASGEKEYRALCSWHPLSKLANEQAKRLLTCHAADGQWKIRGERLRPRHPGGAVIREQLAGKTIRLNFRMEESAP